MAGKVGKPQQINPSENPVLQGDGQRYAELADSDHVTSKEKPSTTLRRTHWLSDRFMTVIWKLKRNSARRNPTWWSKTQVSNNTEQSED